MADYIVVCAGNRIQLNSFSSLELIYCGKDKICFMAETVIQFRSVCSPDNDEYLVRRNRVNCCSLG